MSIDELRAAAQAVLDRWDSPQWEWTKHGPTADLMHALRAALAQPAETDAELERRTGEPHIDGYPLFSGLPPPAQPAASGEPADPDPLHLSRILHEMAGAVSLCWEPRPSGVFESSTACGYVAAAIAEIRSRMPHAQPAPARVPPERLALNVQHPDCHKAADAFWSYWRENGETHKRGYYESTWGAINRALRIVGVVGYDYPAAARDAQKGAA